MKASFGRAIKAGLAAAGAYLTIAVILAAINQPLWLPPNFLYAAGLGIQLSPIDAFTLATSIWAYAFRGLVFGAVFAALFSVLPGATSVRKGIVLSGFLWILGTIEVIYMTPGRLLGEGMAAVGGFLPVSLSSAGLTITSVISGLAFGALVGVIWSRLARKEASEARSGGPALLVGWSLGALNWAFASVGLIIAVVAGGASLPDLLRINGTLWWYGVLYLSVVFLGLPGWILALSAWRRGRRDESEFRLGVAGGICMAITGMMLLPGALAIIGGVISRREHAGEPAVPAVQE